MRICMIGHFAGNLDEGFTNVSSNLVEGLSPCHEIMKLDTKDLLSIPFSKKIKNSNPEIVHQVAGPSFRAFLSLKFAKSQSNAKTIMSALHSESLYLFSRTFRKKFIPLLKPDLMLVQSRESNEIFTDLGCETDFLPNGVKVEKFIPVSEKGKLKLREKYGIPEEKFVILHVGHMIKERNLKIFKSLQSEDNQVLLMTSTHKHKNKIGYDNDTYYLLKKCGCIIWSGYLSDIEEVYQLSDCYVFPVNIGHSLFMPLSVLEAMSCNLPVITTKFEGLTTFFKEGNGLMFVDGEKDILKKVDEIKNGNIEVKTREHALPYSWENIIKKLNGIYNEVATGG